MTPYSEMPYHELSEELVAILKNKTQITDPLFLRIMVGFYFSLAATQMRCAISTKDSGKVPVNMYALNLAPSGFGKTRSCNYLEHHILNGFRDRFLHGTLPVLAETNITKLALDRAKKTGSDPDEDLERLRKEYDAAGEYFFSFNSGTSAAVRQKRHKLLIANAGSINLIMDEVGENLSPNKDVFNIFIELYDQGIIKEKLLKNTQDQKRSAEIVGKTPANLLMFGVPNKLLDGAKTEEEFLGMLESGYARRCFFGYVKNISKHSDMTAQEIFDMRTNNDDDDRALAISNRLTALADPINFEQVLTISDETTISLIEYQLDCERRADELPEHLELQKREIANRFYKVLKLAGAYAFIDGTPDVTKEHIQNAIRLAEDCGESFEQLLARDKPWVKLAKYIAAVGREVTQADLAEDLPFYKGGVGQKAEMMNLAIAYGYKNNIIIKRSFEDNIEFLRGETLKETDLNRIPVSYSRKIAEDYQNDFIPGFENLHKMTQVDGIHWTSHHMKDGIRTEDSAIPGFSLIVLDIDNGTTIQEVNALLKDHKYFLYTTKRHSPTQNRFRLILPMNCTLELDENDYKEFMSNVCEHLPFEIDTQANQRARKWLSNNGHYEYNDGELFDVLPFIPKTSKNERRKEILNTQLAMDNMERWVMNKIGDGNRNNMLLRYALMLVDAGHDFNSTHNRIMSLNNKLVDKLDEAEIIATIMKTVSKKIADKSTN